MAQSTGKRRIALAALLAAVAASAVAQEANTSSETVPTVPVQPTEQPEPLPASTEPDGATKLEDVVVTATKRKEASREVPLSINAFRGDDLEKRGLKSLHQIIQFSPGVNLNSGSSEDSNYLSIRGVTADGRNNVYTRPTGLFLEDAPLTNPSVLSVQPDVEPFDLQTVEVLKGPQGTLFGGSALSGAIRYVPNAPKLHVTQFKLSAGGSTTADSDGYEKEYAGMVNLPVGEWMAIRGAGVYRKSPGWIDEPDNGVKDTNSSHRVQARGALLLQPFESLTLEANYFFRELHVAAGQTVTDVETMERVGTRHASPTDSRVKLYGMRGTWSFGAAEVVAAANRLDIVGSSVVDLSPTLGLSATPVAGYEPFVSTAQQPTYELRLVSREPLWGIDYVLGAFYMHSTQYLRLDTTVAALGALPLPDDQLALILDPIRILLNRPDLSFTEASTSAIIHALAVEKAAFVDLKRTFFDVLEVNLGGRYYNTRTHGVDEGAYNGVVVPVVGPPLPEPVGGLLAPIDTFQSDRGFNPKLALTWKPTRDFSIYASAVRGFRFGGINAVDGAESTALGIPLTFHSDTLWNYELGVRTDWFHGRMTADVTGFYIDWKDPQILQLKQHAFAYTDNVGAARSQGIEGQVSALLPWGFFVNVNGAYIDSRTTVPFDSEDGTIGAGTRMPVTPFVSGSGVVTQKSMLAGWQFLSSYTVSYHGPSHNNLVNEVPLPGYIMHGVSLNVTKPAWRFRPELNFAVTNLFDKRAVLYAQITPSQPLYVGNRPRTLLLTLSLNY